MADLLDRKLVFVTGKGGVGKTTIAAALAWLAADRGKKTLVCEIDAKGDLASFYETGPTRFEEREVAPRLWAMSMDTEASLKQYLSLQLKLPLVAKIGPLAKMFDFVASAAPGVREIVTVGKLCWEVRERHYDFIVVDASASGHIVGQLAAPQAINQLVQVGLVRQQTGWMLDILGDKNTTGLVVVATPAEMPVSETLDLTERIRNETNVGLAAVVVNRVLPELFGRGEEEVFEQLEGDAGETARATLEKELGGTMNPLLEAARLTVTMRRSRTEHLERLRDAIDPSIPMLYMPYLFFRNHGLRATHQIADALSAELRVLMAPSQANSIEALFSSKEIVIACGSGGVGKTTTAAAAAAMAAVKQRGKVLVVTVDPARRLANALGLEGFGNDEKRVDPEAFKIAGVKPRGELWAAMLDTKQSWDDLVHTHAPDRDTERRILSNPLYQNISGKFVQSHDYIAMERLYEIHSSGNYDLIVVDTPPTRNAIDFIEAPRRMADFFSSRLLRLLTAPYQSRFVNMASRPFYQVADRVLGSQFLEDIAEFFILFQTMYSGFVERATAVERLLRDKRTTFVVISTLEAAPVREAEFFIQALTAKKFHLGAVVLNKVLPDYLLDEEAGERAARICDEAVDLARLDGVAGSLGTDVDQLQRVLHEIATNYRNFAVVARREAGLRQDLQVRPEVLATVPEFEGDIHDVSGLLRLGERIWI